MDRTENKKKSVKKSRQIWWMRGRSSKYGQFQKSAFSIQGHFHLEKIGDYCRNLQDLSMSPNQTNFGRAFYVYGPFWYGRSQSSVKTFRKKKSVILRHFYVPFFRRSHFEIFRIRKEIGILKNRQSEKKWKFFHIFKKSLSVNSEFWIFEKWEHGNFWLSISGIRFN